MSRNRSNSFKKKNLFCFLTWVFHYIKTSLSNLLQNSPNSKTCRVEGMNSEWTILIIFSITSDNKPDMQRSGNWFSRLSNVCWTHQLPLVELSKPLKSSLLTKGPHVENGSQLSLELGGNGMIRGADLECRFPSVTGNWGSQGASQACTLTHPHARLT